MKHESNPSKALQTLSLNIVKMLMQNSKSVTLTFRMGMEPCKILDSIYNLTTHEPNPLKDLERMRS